MYCKMLPEDITPGKLQGTEDCILLFFGIEELGYFGETFLGGRTVKAQGFNGTNAGALPVYNIVHYRGIANAYVSGF